MQADEQHDMLIGARVCNNNTGELTGLAALCVQLLRLIAENIIKPVPLTVVVDARYAQGLARSLWTPKENEELCDYVRYLWKRILAAFGNQACILWRK